MTTLLALAVLFIQLSLLAVGGGNAIIPEMQRQVVDLHHWMSAREFSELFALAQASPGPNTMIAALIGWHVAGVAGLMVSTVAQFLPSSTLVMVCMMFWNRSQNSSIKQRVSAALVPVTVGLVLSGGIVVAGALIHNALQPVIIIVSALLFLKTRLPPVVLLLAGGLVSLSLHNLT